VSGKEFPRHSMMNNLSLNQIHKKIKENIDAGKDTYYAILKDIIPGDEENNWGARIKLYRKRLKNVKG